MPKIDITGENILTGLSAACGMTWPQLSKYIRPSKLGADEMGLINCLYGLAQEDLVSFDNLPTNLPEGGWHRDRFVDAVHYYMGHHEIVMRASNAWREKEMALKMCWNGNRGGMPRHEKYIYHCEPVFKMPRADVPQWEVFVAMPFRKELEPVYRDHICNVTRGLDLKVGRADELFSDQSIVDEIWALIINSQIVIADCTGRNPNVFYEIGIAHTVGKPVIAITQSSDDVPFDLSHRRYIKYEMTPRGMADFEKVLSATLYHLMTSESPETDDTE